MFDPRNLDCAELEGAHLTVESNNITVADLYLSGGCPHFLHDGQQPLDYLISFSPPMGLPNLVSFPYVIAADIAPVTCGDGATESFEQCDDGNVLDGDGCSSGCILEDGFGYQVSVGQGGLLGMPGDAALLDFIPYRPGIDDPLTEGFAIVPAAIDFFGSRYAGVMVHVNGYLTLLPELTAGEGGLGAPSPPNAVIAGFGADLALESESAVWHWIAPAPGGAAYVFQYTAVQGRDRQGLEAGPLTFQIAIGSGGEVRLVYERSNFYPDGFTWVGGIEDATSKYFHPVIGCSDYCYGAPNDVDFQFVPF
jgi:cysteine-rich repeat protein